MNELIKNYEDQMGEYVEEIDKKQCIIDDITRSRDRLDLIIKEMELELKKSKENQLKIEVDPLASNDGMSYTDYFSIHSPVEQQFKPIKNEKELMNTEQKIEMAISEKEKVHQKQLKELEENLNRQKDEISRLQNENLQYMSRVTMFKEAEGKLKQKITKYQ